MNSRRLPLLAALFLALIAAHPAAALLLGLAAAPHGEFAAGFAHPFVGLDHILAMGAFGMLAAHKGGRSLWILPAVFVAAMIGGFGIARLGAALPWAELGIAGSVIALGLAIAGSERLSAWVCAGLIALCAILHGHAHGTEALTLADPLRYAGGFAIATAILHGSGIALGTMLRRMHLPAPAGFAVAALGVVLVLQI